MASHVRDIINRNFRLLVQYSGSGTTAFGIDLCLFWLFTTYGGIHYLPAATLAFIVGTTVHFLITRRYVFRRAQRSAESAYGWFVTVGVIGLGLTGALLYVAVDIMGLNAVVARVLVACVVGMVSFVLHKKVSFRHQDETTPHDN